MRYIFFLNTFIKYGFILIAVALMLEHLTVNQRVTGSSPVGRARKKDTKRCLFFWHFIELKLVIRLILGAMPTERAKLVAERLTASGGRKRESVQA